MRFHVSDSFRNQKVMKLRAEELFEKLPPWARIHPLADVTVIIGVSSEDVSKTRKNVLPQHRVKTLEHVLVVDDVRRACTQIFKDYLLRLIDTTSYLKEIFTRHVDELNPSAKGLEKDDIAVTLRWHLLWYYIFDKSELRRRLPERYILCMKIANEFAKVPKRRKKEEHAAP